MEHSYLYRGCATALVTPFSESSVDFSAWETLLARQIGAVNAVVVAGTTGEAPTLSDAEITALTETAVRIVHGAFPVIVGCSANDTAHAVRLARALASTGADALLCAPPYYNKSSPAGQIRHFCAIADTSGLPVMLYNVPSRTGVDLIDEVYDALARYDAFFGIKEASGNVSKIMRLRERYGNRFALYTGDDALILPSLAVGGDGVVSVLSNVCPEEVTELCRKCFASDYASAREMWRKLSPMCHLLFCETNPIPVKYALARLGLCHEEARLPLVPLSPIFRNDPRWETLKP